MRIEIKHEGDKEILYEIDDDGEKSIFSIYDKDGNELHPDGTIKKPTNITDQHWVHTKGIGDGCCRNGQTYIGKWLIFVSATDVDDIWNKIKQYTKSRQLGIESKVSTKLHIKEYRETGYVICVYTRDFRDKENVKDVLQGLRKIGITGKLYYKTDSTTLQGIYTNNGPLTKKKGKSSTYCSTDFEDDKNQVSLFDF